MRFLLGVSCVYFFKNGILRHRVTDNLRSVLTIDIIALVLVQQIGHIGPTARMQALGYPFECHSCLLAQHSGCFDLLFISFWALRQLFFRPIQTPEFFVDQSIGFLLVTLLAFRSVVAATSRLANGRQLLSELIIPQASTAPDLPVISLRFPPPRLSSIWLIPVTKLAEGVSMTQWK